MKRIILILISCFFSTLIFALNRDQVIENAELYLNVKWTPQKNVEDFFVPGYNSAFEIGVEVTGEAYVYGGFDRYGGERENNSWLNQGYTFPQRINLQTCPGGNNTGMEKM
ncbi:MAG: hypothetical protein ABIH68_03665 [bacterium]